MTSDEGVLATTRPDHRDDTRPPVGFQTRRVRADNRGVSWRILGPDGHPLLIGPEKGATLDKTYADEVAKRVRSKAITATFTQDRTRGREKPTPVTYDTLRLMAHRNEWVRAIIKTRQNQVRGKKWTVKVKDTDDPSGAAARAAKAMTKLLTRPQLHGSQPDGVHWQHFIGQYLEDLLVLDRACIEKERDGKGWIKALYPVDGTTIRPVLDERGGYHDDAYVQVVDGIVEARFGMEDLIVSMDNPQTDVRLRGYGVSPLESLVVTVTADLHAAKFNASYFEKGAIPEGILNLGEDVDPELVDAFRIYWLSEIQGKPHALPIIGGSKAPEFMQWRDSNRDMQFMEYQDWLLQKLCAVYQLPKQEVGSIEDVNRSTADQQDASGDRKGIQPLLDLIKNTLDLEVIGELGQGLGDYLEFEWEQQGETADEINQKFAPMHQAGVATGAEWREAHGLTPDGDEQATFGKEGLRMHLAGGELKPLPSHEDAQVSGAAAQQDREDHQMRQQQSREDQMTQQQRDHEASMADKEPGKPTTTGWQPANPDDDDVKGAMAEHDKASGIGPRNVGKTAADGHDRNPAMTRAEDDLTNVFDSATERLVDALTRILQP